MGKKRTSKESCGTGSGGILGEELKQLAAEIAEINHKKTIEVLKDLERKTEEKIAYPTSKQVDELIKAIAALKNNKHLFSEKEEHVLLQQHMVFTLMVPGGRAERAHIALQGLTDKGFFDNPSDWTADKVAKEINATVRWPNQKAARIVFAMSFWPTIVENIKQHLPKNDMAGLYEIRKFLIKNVSGMSNKASAHFMRNVGLFYGDTRAFPIIDTHIYKFLEAYNFKYSKTNYKDAERSFAAAASLTQLPVIFLDAILWCGLSGSWDVANLDFGNFKTLNKRKAA